MDRDTFETLKQKIIKDKNPLRLDDLNPYAALSFLKQNFAKAAACSTDFTLDLWAESMNAGPWRKNALTTTGVRTALQAIFNEFAAGEKEVWLPEDVYPFYAQAASKAGLTPRTFKTLPQPDFSFLQKTKENSAILLANPLAPLGRALNETETTQLKNWLAEGPHRRLVLDTVYIYDHDFGFGNRTLFQTGKTLIAHSLSKSWLERAVIGVVLAPEEDSIRLRKTLRPPTAAACASAAAALTQQQRLPDIQTKIFRNAWQSLAPSIRRIDPAFTAPESGYLAVIRGNCKKALEQENTLIIPASVFGSKNKDLAIISCLQQALKGPQP